MTEIKTVALLAFSTFYKGGITQARSEPSSVCVPKTPCHATECVFRGEQPGIMGTCRLGCALGTLGCGECRFEEGKCKAYDYAGNEIKKCVPKAGCHPTECVLEEDYTPQLEVGSCSEINFPGIVSNESCKYSVEYGECYTTPTFSLIDGPTSTGAPTSIAYPSPSGPTAQNPDGSGPTGASAPTSIAYPSPSGPTAHNPDGTGPLWLPFRTLPPGCFPASLCSKKNTSELFRDYRVILLTVSATILFVGVMVLTGCLCHTRRQLKNMHNGTQLMRRTSEPDGQHNVECGVVVTALTENPISGVPLEGLEKKHAEVFSSQEN